MSQQTLNGTDMDHTITVTSDRLQRAKGALRELTSGEMTIEPLAGGTFEVKGKYEVDPDAPECECKDSEYRETFCKHVVGVHLALMWGEIEPLDAPSTEDDPTAIPPRPDVLGLKTSNIPDRLKEMNHWVCWKQKLHENKDGTRRWTKVPIDPNNGGFASSTDPDTWTDYRTAHRKYISESSLCGLGFVVHEDDDIVGIDIDDCRSPETGRFTKQAAQLLGKSNSYAEISPSGTGARIFVEGEKQTSACQAWLTDSGDGEMGEDPHIEIYDKGRYLTVTGCHIDSTPGDVRPSEILEVVERMCAEDHETASLDDF